MHALIHQLPCSLEQIRRMIFLFFFCLANRSYSAWAWQLSQIGFREPVLASVSIEWQTGRFTSDGGILASRNTDGSERLVRNIPEHRKMKGKLAEGQNQRSAEALALGLH